MIGLYDFIVDRVIAQSVGIQYIVYTNKNNEQTVQRSPGHIIVADIGRQEQFLNLIDEALDAEAKVVLDYRVIDDSTTVSKIVRLDVALIVSSCDKVNEVRASCRSGSRIYRITKRITWPRLLPVNSKVRTDVRVTTRNCISLMRR